MEGEELRKGKERVRLHLIAPLEQAGMRRKANVKLDEHDAFLARIAARLAYMCEADLQSLAEVVEAHAGGKQRDTWPSEVMICNFARRLAIPPASESRLVRSYLQSAAGQSALERGCIVELFWWLRKHGAPPNEYGWSEIERQSRDNRDQRRRVRQQTERGTVSRQEEERVKAYWAAHERCLSIIDTKDEGVAA